MKYPKTKLHMIQEIANESGHSIQKVKFVIKNFEESLTFFLSNPIEAGEMILLSTFGKFVFNKKRAKNRMARFTGKKKETYIEYFKSINDEEE